MHLDEQESDPALPVTREQARIIAEDYVKKLVPRPTGWTGILDVRSFDEVARISIYQYWPEPLSESWIAYVDRPLRGRISSSDVIVISRRRAEWCMPEAPTTKGNDPRCVFIFGCGHLEKADSSEMMWPT